MNLDLRVTVIFIYAWVHIKPWVEGYFVVLAKQKSLNQFIIWKSSIEESFSTEDFWCNWSF